MLTHAETCYETWTKTGTPVQREGGKQRQVTHGRQGPVQEKWFDQSMEKGDGWFIAQWWVDLFLI